MGMKEKESIYHFFGKLPDFVKEKRILLPGERKRLLRALPLLRLPKGSPAIRMPSSKP